MASYSRRSTWLALCSMTLSMAAVIGFLFVATTQTPSQVRTRAAWAASELSLVIDQQSLDELASAMQQVSMALQRASTAIRQVSTVAERVALASYCDLVRRPGCGATAGAEPPAAAPEAVQATASTGWLGNTPDAEPAAPEAEQTAATPDLPATKPDEEASSEPPVTSSDSPVSWRLDDPEVQAGSAEGILIRGTNVSDQAFEDVHAILKPDSTERDVELVLNVEGQKPGTVIPAGAQFSLVSQSPNDDGSRQGGAILTFRYVQAGDVKTSILYLTPAMVARLANRG